MPAFFLAPRRCRHSGVALIIVLAFVVLLTGVIIAFFSRTLQERQLANSNAGQMEVDLFARGALDTITGDLRNEAKIGSAYLNAASATAPVPATAMPLRVGTNDALPNLYKATTSSQAFYTNGPVRASNVLTTTASVNGRSISLGRWNKPVLLPKANANTTDLTPAAAFTAPSWVMVARDGSNPTAYSATLADRSPGNSQFVVGRYACTVYDEGGLLDLNAASAPAVTPAYTPTNGFLPRNLLSCADLTQLVGISSMTSGMQQFLTNAIVGWRNYATARPTGSFATFGFSNTQAANYYNYLLTGNPSFRSPSSLQLFNGQSDRLFSGRQELIQFLTQGVANSSGAPQAPGVTVPLLQQALQELGTFSRDLNQPSFAPDPTRPKIRSDGGTAAFGNAGTGSYGGGNDAYQGDSYVPGDVSIINPAFGNVLVTNAFTRLDGSQAMIGEPLVKSRFLLNRLAWLTYKGPSADLLASNPDDPVLGYYMTTAGITKTFLQQGTAYYIKAYFGLQWDPTNHRWTYKNGQNSGSGPILTLKGTTTTPGVALLAIPREPDFFELLKAAINAGSTGKGSEEYDACGGFQQIKDTTTDYQIMQIGANMVDQFDPDSYPTRILFTPVADGSIVPQEFRGIEDLPYLYRVRPALLQTRKASPFAAVGTGPVAGTLSDGGQCTCLLVGDFWNPTAPNSPLPALQSVVPAKLRCWCEQTDPDHSSGTSNGTMSFYIVDSSGSSTASGSPQQVTMNMASTAVYFLPSQNTHFMEPEMLNPGCGVEVGSRNNILKVATANTAGFIADYTVPASGNIFTGLACLGVEPVRRESSTSATIYTAAAKPNLPTIPQVVYANVSDTTFHVQYLDPVDGVNYDDYDVKYFSNMGGATLPDIGTSYTEEAGTSGFLTLFDPRTIRFSDQGGRLNTGSTQASGSMIWLDAGPHFISTSNRPTYSDSGYCGSNVDNPGYGNLNPATAAQGWLTDTYWLGTGADGVNLLRQGLFSQNDPLQNNSHADSNPQYYQDADGVARRAMGSYVQSVAPGNVGLPMAQIETYSAATGLTTLPAQYSSRPIMLNRPFQSVAELGYVYRGEPWKNIDFFNPESGDTALLDVFCIADSPAGNPLVGGKINLNTRNKEVLQAVLVNTPRDILYSGTGSAIGTLPPLTRSEAGSMASAIVARTINSSQNAWQGPARNVGEIVGRYVGAYPSTQTPPSDVYPAPQFNGNGTSQYYSGYTTELTSSFDAGSSNGAEKLIQRFREAPIRALADVGNARTWNLLIDVVAQTGRYTASSTDLSKFVVQGEKRYWLHVAIDRVTGQILDQSLEPVTE